MKRIRRAQSLDGGDCPTIGLQRWQNAGVDGQTIQQDRAGSALPLSATVLNACEMQPLTQDMEQRLEGLYLDLHGIAVEGEDQLFQPDKPLCKIA
jgi:hypothetical protein